ncbi:MAG: hypothetical protein JSS72_07300 [Armatimonadetes bacterium]|nr:hypothetical protein [Armatimonadota bacterium]
MTAIVASISTRQAYGYLDPGSGSFLLQMVVAGVLGGLYTMKATIRSVTSGLLRKSRAK